MDVDTKKGIILGLVLIFGAIIILSWFNPAPEIYGLIFLGLLLAYGIYSGLRKRDKP